MKSTRKRFEAGFKAKVAIEAIKEEKTISDIAGKFQVHPNQVNQWKKVAIEGIPELFSLKKEKDEKEREAKEDELYKQIGQLKVELDWVKKKSGLFK